MKNEAALALLREFILTESIKIDADLLVSLGCEQAEVEQLLAADAVREISNHYWLTEQLTLENAQRLLASGGPGMTPRYPTTPDGRYFVVRGRLWRKTNPNLPEHERVELTSKLMAARRALRGNSSPEKRADARAAVDQAKVALGERGPVWWLDGAPDYNRHMVQNTPYAAWFASLGA